MRQAVLTFDEGTMAEWGFAAFQDAGVSDVDMLSCEGSRGVVRIHVEEKIDERRLDENDTIEWWERVASENSKYVYLVEASVSEPRDRPDRLPRTEQMEVHDGGFTLHYFGTQERISTMVAEFEAKGIDVALRKLQSYHAKGAPLDVLTDRQREVLEVAFRHGYYDVPRNSSTGEIAARLELDDSTVAEHLQRAERNLISTVLGHDP